MGSVYGGESVASIARSEQEDAAPLDTGIPGMPPSWVPRLQIGRDSLDMRCPRGIKSLLYHRCQHEIFALFGECCRWDGMVEKLTLYEVGLLYCAVLCHAVLCCAVLCCAVLCCAVLCCGVLCRAVMCSTVPCWADQRHAAWIAYGIACGCHGW